MAGEVRRATRWVGAGIVALALTLGLRQLSLGAPATIERVYARGVYPFLARALAVVAGALPFSFAEALVAMALLLAAVWLVTAVAALRRAKAGHRLAVLWRRIAPLLVLTCAAYVGFILLWGLNYGRQPFGVTIGLTTQPASVDELAALCTDLIARSNTLRAETRETADGVMQLNGSIGNALARAQLGYDRAAERYPVLAGHYGRPKGVLVSPLWSYTGITGMYSAFTGEANVNTDQPLSSLPHTAAHEMAHQRGFAREDEANYIAYLVCEFHPDADYRYSGVLAATVYTANALYAVAPERYQALAAGYSDAVRRDLRAESAYWRAHQGVVADVADRINDQYLRSNGQTDGVQSYGRMVDLLLAEYRARKTGN